MTTVAHQTTLRSESLRNKDGSPREYTVKLLLVPQEKGPPLRAGSCTCPDFMIRGVNNKDGTGQAPDGTIIYRCKHVRQFAASIGGWDRSTEVVAPKPPPRQPTTTRPSTGVGLRDLDLTRRGRRARRDLSD